MSYENIHANAGADANRIRFRGDFPKGNGVSTAPEVNGCVQNETTVAGTGDGVGA
jgi:hypothetical protein